LVFIEREEASVDEGLVNKKFQGSRLSCDDDSVPIHCNQSYKARVLENGHHPHVLLLYEDLTKDMSHLVFRKIQSANYMCAQDIHMTHIGKNIENIKNNALLYIKHSYNKTYNYYKSIAETILNLLFRAPFSTGTVD
jgi:virulence-associated protein VapD